MRQREPQWRRVYDYIFEHGSISRRIAVTALDVYELSSRIADAEREMDIKFDREKINYTNSWGEHRPLHALQMAS